MKSPHGHDDERRFVVLSDAPSSGLPEMDESTWPPATNRDQSCEFCGRSQPRFAHRLDPKCVQFRVFDKGWTLPGFWTVCDKCEVVVVSGNDEELLRIMHEADDVIDVRLQRASLAAFRAADLAAVPLQDA